MFGLLDDLIDGVIEAPGKIIEKTVETVVRVPEIGIKATQGIINGAEKGVEKVEEALDDLGV